MDKRFVQHLLGLGAAYTRSHPPLGLLAVLEYPDRASASSAEYAMKQMSASEKRAYALLLALGGAAAGVERL